MGEILPGKHDTDSTIDHNGVSGATEDNLQSFDANGLPKDSGLTTAEVTANTSARHAESHAVASHNDTTATGTELETLTDGSDSDGLHAHTLENLTDTNVTSPNNNQVMVWNNSTNKWDAHDFDATRVVLDTKAAETIAEGDLVYEFGQDSGVPTIKKAKSDSATTMPCIGVAIDAGNTNDDIRVVMTGILNSTNTSMYTIRDPLYVSSATAGEHVNAKPIGTAEIQKIGTVLNVDASGNILVSGANRTNDIPNIPQNNVWNGDSNGVAQATDDPTVANLTFTDPQGDNFTARDLAAHQLDAFNEMATTEFDTTAATATSARTITINQPEAEKIEVVLGEKRLEQASQIDLTVDMTAFAGSNASPNDCYTYIQNTADVPALVCSNTAPDGVVAHVDGVYEVVGTVGVSATTVYASLNKRPYIHEKLEKIVDRLSNTLYKSGMAITASASSFAIASGTVTHVVNTLTTPALTLAQAGGGDDQFTIEDDDTYTVYDTFQIDEYFDGTVFASPQFMLCRIGIVMNNPAGTTARFHIIPQDGSTTYPTALKAWGDLNKMHETTPRNDIVKACFVDVADIVIGLSGATYSLAANPDTGLYHRDVRSAGGNGAGGGGGVSQNVYEKVTGDSGTTTAPSPTGSLAIEGAAGVVTAVTTDTVTIKVARTIIFKPIPDTDALTVADGLGTFVIPEDLNGMNLVSAQAHVFTASTSGLPSIQIHNLTHSGGAQDMLSTNITIDANEKDSSTATTPSVVNTANDDVETGNEIRVDGDVAGTDTEGLEIRLKFATP